MPPQHSSSPGPFVCDSVRAIWNTLISSRELKPVAPHDITPSYISSLTAVELSAILNGFVKAGFISITPPVSRQELLGEVLGYILNVSPTRHSYEFSPVFEPFRAYIAKYDHVMSTQHTTPIIVQPGPLSNYQTILQQQQHNIPQQQRPAATPAATIPSVVQSSSHHNTKSTITLTRPPALTDQVLMTYLVSLARLRASADIRDILVQPIACKVFELSAAQSSATKLTYRATLPSLPEVQLKPNEHIVVRLFGERAPFTYNSGRGNDTHPPPTDLSPALVVKMNIPSSPWFDKINSTWQVIPWALGQHKTSNLVCWLSGAVDHVVIPSHDLRLYQSQLLGKHLRHNAPICAPIEITRPLQSTDSLEVACVKDEAWNGCILVEKVRRLTLDECVDRIKQRAKIDIVPELDTPQCAFPTCVRSKDLLRCSACHSSFYCGSEHQRLHWPSHRLLCRDLAKRRLVEIDHDELQKKKNASTNSADDDGIAVASSSVSLLCPLSGSRPVIPVRSINCAHARCFDLVTWIRSTTHSNKVNSCPHCSISILLDDLAVSQRMEHAIKTLPDTVDLVVLDEETKLYVPYNNNNNNKNTTIVDTSSSSAGRPNPGPPRPNNNIQSSDNQLVQLPPPASTQQPMATTTTTTTTPTSSSSLQPTATASSAGVPPPPPPTRISSDDVIDLD